MKQIVSSYSYSPATNVVTLTGVNIEQDQLLLVVAPQVGRTMYNFASGVTGSVSAGANTRVTLNASTVGLTTTSPLVIFYDDHAATQIISGTVTANLGFSEQYDDGGDALKVNLWSYGNPPEQVTSLGIPISGTVTVGSCVTHGVTISNSSVTVGLASTTVTVSSLPAISGTVTANVASTTVTVSSLPAISGTVTANASNGTLTTRFGTPTTASVAFATTCVTNANRKYLLIQNVTTQSNVITVGIGFTPTTTQGIQLTAGAGITFESSYIPTGQVFVLSSVTASNFTILEAPAS